MSAPAMAAYAAKEKVAENDEVCFPPPPELF